MDTCENARPMRMRVATAGLAAVLALSGCGGSDDPATLDGVTPYDATIVARDAMDDEAIDEESPAYRGTWLVDDTEAERLEDGTWAWRVTFVSLDDQSDTLCIWVQPDERTVDSDHFSYFVDHCPVPASS
jgi:hypothetical protein